ncbi:MAG TPA: SUMF1/EgtB/PvdO family nonheme iron enzyme [Anaerolineales bacterium]|nr:SUMF1/EgtB/PvdO family nonheme iron enzyme [Anaerolineales bacterium]
MKKFLMIVSVLTVLTLALGACGPTATSTEAPQTEETQPSGQSATADGSEQPTEAPTDVAIKTVDLVGPPMEVGSKYMFVDGTVLVAVPGGEFTMGYNFADNPERKITVGDFWIYSTKVTNRQYAMCVAAGKCTPPDPEKAPNFGTVEFTNFPVTGVTHTQAAEYCGFVKGHLPTEAQWEKAARGPEGNIFPWGNGAPTCSLTNYALCKGQSTSVNDYPDGKSFYEAWDMSGNVREWVADWYSPVYNVDSPVADPLGPELGEKRSVRGSSYADSANMTIAAHRFSLDPNESSEDVGFRCVIGEPDPSTLFAPWCELVGYAGTGPDGTPGSCTPEVKCNGVNISVSQFCEPGKESYSVVTLEVVDTPPDSWEANPPAGCSVIDETAEKKKYLCTVDSSASATGSCVDTVQCAATCPMNYNKVGDKCVWDGSGTSGTDCLPGATYDPLTQCCTATPGMGVDFGLCPAGFYNVNGVCVPNPKGTVKSVTSVVDVIENCAVPTDDPNDPGDEPDNPGGGGCTPPSKPCQTWETYDPATCTCIP